MPAVNNRLSFFVKAHVLGCTSGASYLLPCDNTTQREVNVTYKAALSHIERHGWRTFYRARVQIIYKYQRNIFYI
jgi:hypothetical protein